MKLENVTKIAEITASIAVLVSLLILIGEIQENTKTTKRTAYESLSSQVASWRMARVVDAELHQLWDRETESREWTLEGGERKRFISYIEVLWQIYEQAFYASQAGDLGGEEWNRFRVWICDKPPPMHVWEEVEDIMSKPFSEFVTECRNE